MSEPELIILSSYAHYSKEKKKLNFKTKQRTAVSLSVNCPLIQPLIKAESPAVILSVLDPSSGNSPETSTFIFKIHAEPLASSLHCCLPSSGPYCLCCSLTAPDTPLASLLPVFPCLALAFTMLSFYTSERKMAIFFLEMS